MEERQEQNPNKSEELMDSERLRGALLGWASRFALSPKSVEQDKLVGRTYGLERRKKDLTRGDVVKAMGIEGFRSGDLALFEQGLLSLKDMPLDAIGGLVRAVPEVLDTEQFKLIREDETFRTFLEGNK